MARRVFLTRKAAVVTVLLVMFTYATWKAAVSHTSHAEGDNSLNLYKYRKRSGTGQDQLHTKTARNAQDWNAVERYLDNFRSPYITEYDCQDRKTNTHEKIRRSVETNRLTHTLQIQGEVVDNTRIQNKLSPAALSSQLSKDEGAAQLSRRRDINSGQFSSVAPSTLLSGGHNRAKSADLISTEPKILNQNSYEIKVQNQNHAPTKLENQASAPPQIKTIAIFNPPFWFPRAGRGYFSRCPVSACNFLGPVNSETSNFSVDAVIFHPEHDLHQMTPPKRTSPEQMYVFYRMESPAYTSQSYRDTAWNSIFNWTWTYRRDSDIWSPVNYIKRSSYVPSLSFFRALRQQKTFPVAWFSSRCGVPSQRDEYVKKLKDVIDVHIYGGCGNLKCGKNGNMTCVKMLSDRYLFYLSFENSFCQDYVTEKLFRTFKENIHVIPVVRGGLKYAQFYPKGTFIDADDFPSAESLGRYLVELINDDKKYVEMLWRKAHFVYHEHGMEDSWCQLCAKLHNLPSSRKHYPDMHAWFHQDTCWPPKPF